MGSRAGSRCGWRWGARQGSWPWSRSGFGRWTSCQMTFLNNLVDSHRRQELHILGVHQTGLDTRKERAGPNLTALKKHHTLHRSLHFWGHAGPQCLHARQQTACGRHARRCPTLDPQTCHQLVGIHPQHRDALSEIVCRACRSAVGRLGVPKPQIFTLDATLARPTRCRERQALKIRCSKPTMQPSNVDHRLDQVLK